jgi:hypothetical protein
LEQQTLYAYPFDELLNGADEQLMGLMALPLWQVQTSNQQQLKVEMYHEVLKN